MDLEKSLKKISEFFDSEEGQEYIANQQRKNEIHQARLEKFHLHLSTLSDEEFSRFIDKLIAKHDDAYRDRIWNKRIEPHPNHLMTLLFDTAFEQASSMIEPFDEFAQIFSSATVEYRGFYFGCVHGQGSVSQIFSPQKLLIFQL